MRTWWYLDWTPPDIDHWYLDGRSEIVYVVLLDGTIRQTRLKSRIMDVYVDKGLLVEKNLPGKYARILRNNRRGIK